MSQTTQVMGERGLKNNKDNNNKTNNPSDAAAACVTADCVAAACIAARVFYGTHVLGGENEKKSNSFLRGTQQ